MTSDASESPPFMASQIHFELGFLRTFSQSDNYILSQCLLGTCSHKVHVFQKQEVILSS